MKAVARFHTSAIPPWLALVAMQATQQLLRGFCCWGRNSLAGNLPVFVTLAKNKVTHRRSRFPSAREANPAAPSPRRLPF